MQVCLNYITRLVFILLLCFFNLKAQHYNWVKSYGSRLSDGGTRVLNDVNGNVYFLGTFKDTVDFDPGPNTYTLVSTTYIGGDGFLLKLDSSGLFQWVKHFSGIGIFNVSNFTIDYLGNFYVTGSYDGSVDADPGPGTFILSSNGPGYNSFIIKLNPTGNFIWAKNIGASGANCGIGPIESDANGNLVLSGNFETPSNAIDFDPGSGIHNLYAVGGHDVFLLKINPLGDAIFAFSFGGQFGDSGHWIKIDKFGNIYLTGMFDGTCDFDPGVGSNTINGYQDIFVAKYNSNGQHLWAKALSGNNVLVAHTIELDQHQNIILGGYFRGSADFDPGPAILTYTSNWNSDSFITKWDSLGNYIWSSFYGGASHDESMALCLDANDNIYTTGYFQDSCIFNVGNSQQVLTTNAIFCSFVSKFDSTGQCQWAKALEEKTTTSTNYATSISVDFADNIYLAGSYQGTVDFNPDIGFAIESSRGISDAYLLKLGSCNLQIAATSPVLICSGESTNLVCFGASIYSWSPGQSTSSTQIVSPVISTTYSVTGYVSQNCTDSLSIHVQVDDCVGLENEFQNENKPFIFPNPCTSVLYIENLEGSKNFSLYNHLGQTVSSSQLITNNQIDLSQLNLPSGLYFIEISGITHLVIFQPNQ